MSEFDLIPEPKEVDGDFNLGLTPEITFDDIPEPDAMQSPQSTPDILDEILYQSADVNPKDAADFTRLSKKYDLPVPEAKNALPELRKKEKVESFNIEEMRQNYPGLKKMIEGNPTLAWVFRDHIDNLKGLEDLAQGNNKNSAVGNMLRNAGERVTTLAGNAVGFVDTVSNSIEETLQEHNMGLGEITYRQPKDWKEVFTFGNIGYRSGAEAQKLKDEGNYPKSLTTQLADTIKDTKFGYVPDATWESVKKKFKDGGALSADSWGELIAYSFETGGASLVDMGAMVANLPVYIASRAKEMGDVRSKNKGLKETTGQEIAEATPFVIGSVLLDKLSLGKMLGVGKAANETAEKIGKDALEYTYKKAVKEAGKATGFEMTTEFVQEGLIEYVGEKFGTKAKMRAQEAFDRGLGGAVAAGPLSASISTASGVVNTREAAKQKALKVETEIAQKTVQGATDQDKLDQYTSLAQSLIEQSPESANEVLESMQEQYPDMPSHVTIQARDLKEGISEVEITPEVEKYYSEILEGMPTNEDIEIPLTEYAQYFAESGTIRENVRLSPDGMSILDIKNAEPAMNAITERMMKEADLSIKEHEKSVEIYNSIADQLYDTGKLSSREAKLAASLYPAYMARAAKEHGITIEEAYNTIPGINITAKDEVAPEKALEQAKTETIGELTARLSANYPIKSLSLQDGDVLTLSDIEIEKDSRKSGEGSKVIQEIIDYADSVGKRIELTPDKKEGAGTTSINRLKKFYKSHGFIENKGKNKDFSTTHGMYREPAKGLKKDSANLLAQSKQAESGGVSQTETPEFKAWFGNSEVVDKKGEPLIVYHGSPSEFDVFDQKRIGASATAEGYGFYFTDNKDIAKGYTGKDGNLMKVYLSMKKPIDTKNKRFSVSELKKIINTAIDNEIKKYDGEIEDYKDSFISNYVDTYGMSRDAAVSEVAQILYDNNDNAVDQISELVNVYGDKEDVARAVTESTGYDGYHVKDFQDGEGDVYIAWFPEQIKSATDNSGAFDPNDPSILKQENRASIQRTKSEYLINLGKQSDRSSFLHESGHLFLDLEKTFAEKYGLTDNQKAILAYLEVDSFDDIDFFKYVDMETRLKAGEDIGMSNKELKSKLDTARAAHEKFAESFEAYLHTGKAPSVELRNAFRAFRDWLIGVYKSLVPHGITLSKDTTDMFDSLLATEEQIAEMEATYHYEEDVKATTKAKEILQTQLFKELYKRASDDWKYEKAKIANEIKKDLEESDLYKAEDFISKKENRLDEQQVGEALGYREPKSTRKKELDPSQDSLLVAIAKLGGIDREHAEQHGINPAYWSGKRNLSNSLVPTKPVFRAKNGLFLSDLMEKLGDEGYVDYNNQSENDLLNMIDDELRGVEHYSNRYEPDLSEYTEEDANAEYPRKPKRLYGTTAKNGLDIDLVAEQFGYSSGETMLRDLAESNPIDVEASNQAQEIMLERHGDILNDGSLEELAKEEAFSEERGRALIRELKKLNKKQTSGINREMLQRSAENIIANTPLNKLRPEQYHRKEVKASQEYQQYKANDDKDMMVQAKMDQLINFYLYREARKAKEQSEKYRDYLQKVKTRKYSAGTVDSEYINHVKKYVALFEFRKNPDKTNALTELQNLSNWVQQQNLTNPEGYKPQFYHPLLAELADPEVDSSQLKIKSYKEMTPDELRQINEMTKHLLFIGRKLSNDSKMEAKQVVYDLEKAAEKNLTKKNNPKRKKDESWRDTFSFWAQASTMLHIRELDGTLNKRAKMADGAFYKNIWTPILESSNVHVELEEELDNAIKEQIRPYFDRLKGKSKDFDTEGGTLTLDGEQRIMFAVYYGSEESRQALLENGGANSGSILEHQAQTILDSLSDEDIKIVEAIWKINESLRSRVFQTERDINGIAPKAVEAVPFTVNGKELKGGYQRIKYESHAKDELGRDDPMTAAMNSIGRAGISMSKTGSTIERKGSGGRTLALEFNNFTGSLQENVQFIAYAKTSRQVHQILSNPDLKATLQERLGDDRYRAMIDSINGTFVGETIGNFGRSKAVNFFRNARQKMSVAMLMYSFRNIVQQVIGGTNLMVNLKTADYSKAAFDFMGDTKEWTDFVESRSPMMRNRMKFTNREVNEMVGSLANSADNSFIAGAKRYGFAPQTAIDKAMGMPAWLAAYRDGMAMYGNEEQAIQHADQLIVDALGSGQSKDLPPLFTGAGQGGNPLAIEAMKQFSFMGSFFNMVGQQYYRTIKGNKLSTVKGATTAARDMAWTLVIPAILSALVVDDIPDEEEWWKWSLRKIGGYGLSSIIGIREIYSLSVEGFAPSSPAANTYKAMDRIFKSTNSVVVGDKEFSAEYIAKMLKATAPFLGIPGQYQAARMIEGAVDDNQDIYGALTEGKERNK